MSPDDLALFARVTTGFGLGFILGFEREVRGSAAGGRTFALVGAGAAGVTAVTASTAPQAIGGIVTGVGFIGAGIVFHREGGVSGLTTAATDLRRGGYRHRRGLRAPGARCGDRSG